MSCPGPEPAAEGLPTKADVVARLSGTGAAAEPAAPGPSGSIADGKANDGSEALSGDQGPSGAWAGIEALAVLLEPEAFDLDQPYNASRRAEAKSIALRHAAKVITSGWRRVVEDDTTVELLAIALAYAEGVILTPESLREPWGKRSVWAAKFESLARAAVRAVLGEDQ